MPTFDFRCAGCKGVFEKTLPFGSKAAVACPACKSKKTEKILTVPAISFRGSGFFKTDNAKKTEEKPVEAKKEEKKPEKIKESNTSQN